jgi:6-phosphogluconolactonase
LASKYRETGIIEVELEFISAQSSEPVSVYLAKLITAQLSAGRSVLWLLSGGSAIKVAVDTSALLDGQDFSKLVVSLMDERFVPVGHPDSNWQQLGVAGLKLPGATLHPVLAGTSQKETASAFAVFLEEQFAGTQYHLGVLGIGPDGHTSGILPHSEAVTAQGLICAYQGPDYQRITTTAKALKQLNEAVLYVAGETKWPVLDRLETELPVADQPAQLLKTMPKTTIFTDRPLS